MLTPSINHGDPIASVLLWVTLIFSFGMCGRFIAQRLNQPGVLGELLMGVLVGNLCYLFKLPEAIIFREGSIIFTIMSDVLGGMSLTQAVHASMPDVHYATLVTQVLQSVRGTEIVKVAYALDIFSRYGVIFLLFMVGLESSVAEIRQTGRESFQVALIGVLAPMALGFLVTGWLIPEASFNTTLFVGATLTATSVGITARVLKEMKKMQTREAKTILGAAMIDDILGLMILAVVSSIVVNGRIDSAVIFKVTLLTVLFFVAVLWLGPKLLRMSARFLHFLPLWEAKLITAFSFVMLLSWLATCVQLTSIIGAFAAGLIIHDEYFDKHETRGEKRLLIHELVAPLELLLAPLFFMLIGIQVKLETFLDWHVLLIALGLVVVAVLGKLLSGLGASKRDDRFLIGIGMLPRGEVGLVFASIGRALGVISDQLFSAIIIMVIITTFVAPPWLKLRFSRHKEMKA